MPATLIGTVVEPWEAKAGGGKKAGRRGGAKRRKAARKGGAKRRGR